MDARPAPPVTPARPSPDGGWLAIAPTFRLHTDGATTSAAELDVLAARWRAWMAAAGLAAGDRMVCALPPGPAFAAVCVAAARAGVTFAPVPATADVEAALVGCDARVAVVAHLAAGDGAGLAAASRDGGPPEGRAPAPRPARGPRTPDARLLLLTSGSTGAPRRLALSDANVAAVLASHAAPLALDASAVALSVLPWHHVFGLVLELLAALAGGSTLLRDPAGGRDANALLALAAARPLGAPPTHLHAVPHTVRLLAERDDGHALLPGLRAGLVGGAPVDAWLAGWLAGTRLRVGYGQTEASPGIALGEPGAWRAGTLGRPLGCAVRLDDDGVLAFRGPNACLGAFSDGALAREAPDRWVRTGDLARAESDGTFTFEGRAADSFKLENGRYVAALAVERRVRARWPRVAEALLSSPDGRRLVLAASTAAPDDPLPNAADVAPLLGPLARRPLDVVRVPPDAWARTPKGDLDRRFPTGRA